MIDCHMHLAAQNLQLYPHAQTPQFHTEPYVRTAETALQEMAEAGVSHAAAVQPFALYGTDNAYHADSAKKYPNRFMGICGVALTAEGAAQLRYWTTERGMTGGRVSTLGQGLDLENPHLLAIFATAQQHGLPICLLTSRKHIPALPALAARFEGVQIGLDHLGNAGNDIDAESTIRLLEPLAAFENIILKISTTMLVSGDAALRIMAFILEKFGPKRIAWGTNYPVTDLGGYATTVAASRTALANLSEAERQAIFNDTARLLWAPAH